jgi:2-keto-4-pentenoate hydratase/2-oxohepta-3-ene-1,7-dioic acid hydratase in catechol pathway
MRLVTYKSSTGWRAGLAMDGKVIDAEAAAGAAQLEPLAGAGWSSNRNIIQAGVSQQAVLARAAASLVATNTVQPAIKNMGDLLLGPPIPDPDKIICLGLNYKSHIRETSLATADVPILFAKFRNSLTGPTSPILLPLDSQKVDFEGELAVVVGRTCKNANAKTALDYVAGYMVFNDVSARDVQFRTSQWLSGKTLDTFAPCGPALVVNEIADPQALTITTRLNGQTLQHGYTADMIFSVAESLAYISRLFTLQAGDIIATGTPDGVGFKRTPPIFLTHDDLVEVEIQGIGTLSNPVIDPTQL